MKEKVVNVLKKNKSIILYLIFGVSSTILNIAVYAICTKIFSINYTISNIIAWIFAVTFAYLTNRVYVFDSKANNKKSVIKEVVLFFYYRILTLVLEFILLYIGIDMLNVDDLIVKIISNIVVIVANYVFSKFLIFSQKNKGMFEKKIYSDKQIIKSFFVLLLPPLIVFSVVLLAHWPGILISDSVVQWNQVQTGVYTNWHPIFATLTIKLLASIWNNTGFVLFMQLLTISCVSSYLLTRLQKYFNINLKFLMIISILFAVYPLNFNFAVTMLKDIIYSTGILLLLGFTLDIIFNKEWLKKWYNIIFIILDLILISTYRHNGIIVVCLTLITFIIVLKSKRKIVSLISIVWVVIYLISNTLVTSIFNVEKATYANTYGPVAHVFARMLNTPKVEFTEEELQILANYVDIDKLKNTYHQFNMDPSINSQKYESLKGDTKDYLKLLIKKSVQYPDVFVKHYLKLTSFLYSPIQIHPDAWSIGMTTETDLYLYADEYPELNMNSKLPKVYELCKKIEERSQDYILGQFTKRPALWMYISIIMIIFLVKKYKNKKIWLLILPSLFNTLSLAPAIPVPITRYVYASMLVAWILIPLGIFEMCESTGKKKITDGK